uniref:Uncharacterized protein n=1 Tax=viral metagenome TaxID=1070528 RepID=A0A6C0DQ55_9ZZZZ
MSNPALGDGIQGISPIQTINNYKDSEQSMIRRKLRTSWNNVNSQESINEIPRIITPYRAVNNLGDYLSRQAYVCGGSNQVNASKPGWKSRIGSIISQCDETGIAAGAGNQRFVSDSSDYITYKKQLAVQKGYNDSKNGGDQSNGSFVSLMSVRRR